MPQLSTLISSTYSTYLSLALFFSSLHFTRDGMHSARLFLRLKCPFFIFISYLIRAPFRLVTGENFQNPARAEHLARRVENRISPVSIKVSLLNKNGYMIMEKRIVMTK